MSKRLIAAFLAAACAAPAPATGSAEASFWDRFVDGASEVGNNVADAFRSVETPPSIPRAADSAGEDASALGDLIGSAFDGEDGVDTTAPRRDPSPYEVDVDPK